jgi:hypothetical protein
VSTIPTEPSYKDAKAQAKAAKAYAKAQRPFYRKKRFIVPAALIAVVVIAMAMSGGGSDNGSVVNESGSAASDNGAAQTGSADKPYKIGNTVELEGTQYTVTAAKTASSVGGEFGEKADGTLSWST